MPVEEVVVSSVVSSVVDEDVDGVDVLDVLEESFGVPLELDPSSVSPAPENSEHPGIRKPTMTA